MTVTTDPDLKHTPNIPDIHDGQQITQWMISFNWNESHDWHAASAWNALTLIRESTNKNDVLSWVHDCCAKYQCRDNYNQIYWNEWHDWGLTWLTRLSWPYGSQNSYHWKNTGWHYGHDYCYCHNKDNSQSRTCTTDTIHTAGVNDITDIAGITQDTQILTWQATLIHIINCK